MASSIKRVAAAGALTVALLSSEAQDANGAFSLIPSVAALEVKESMQATTKLETKSEVEQKSQIKTEVTQKAEVQAKTEVQSTTKQKVETKASILAEARRLLRISRLQKERMVIMGTTDIRKQISNMKSSANRSTLSLNKGRDNSKPNNSLRCQPSIKTCRL